MFKIRKEIGENVQIIDQLVKIDLVFFIFIQIIFENLENLDLQRMVVMLFDEHLEEHGDALTLIEVLLFGERGKGEAFKDLVELVCLDIEAHELDQQVVPLLEEAIGLHGLASLPVCLAGQQVDALDHI